MASDNPTQRLNASYLVGTYLAVNAIPDAHILVDGPDCALIKTEFIYGNHDLCSTLLDSSGLHRIAHTSTDPCNITENREPSIARMIKELAARRDRGVLFISSLPFCSIVAVDYDRIIRGASAQNATPILRIPSDALSGDWLDGYADALEALARAVDLAEAKPDPDKVAVVGYLMDRTEQDHIANLLEMERLLEGLGLELVSVWLGNVPYGRLSDIKRAGTILSLPYGRQAARILAERVGARLIELDLPFGLEPTERWLRTIAEACGRVRQAQGLIDRELEPVLKRLERVVPQALLHKRVALCGDPYLFEGLVRLADDLGWEVAAGAVMSRPDKPLIGIQAKFPGLPQPLFQPAGAEWEAELSRAQPIDFIIGNSSMLTHWTHRGAVVEFGFPSYGYHALSEQPFLGFRGCLKFVERVLNALLGNGR